ERAAHVERVAILEGREHAGAARHRDVRPRRGLAGPVLRAGGRGAGAGVRAGQVGAGPVAAHGNRALALVHVHAARRAAAGEAPGALAARHRAGQVDALRDRVAAAVVRGALVDVHAPGGALAAVPGGARGAGEG